MTSASASLAGAPAAPNPNARSVGVVVVSFETRELLRECLASVIEDGAAEVIVVDNASSDGSAEMVSSDFPTARLVVNAVNVGYGSAANQGVRTCPLSTVLLLNADTRVRPGTLGALGVYLEEHPTAALVGPRIVDEAGVRQPSCFPFPDPLHTFLDTTVVGGLARALPSLRRRWPTAYLPESGSSVPWLLGAALAIRREPFLGLGGFDEAFFLYSEEVDLCYRVTQAGWEVHFTPNATVVHTGGASTRQQSLETEPRRYFATQDFYRRHYRVGAQRVLTILTTYRMLHNMARDSLALWRSSSPSERTRLETQLAVWRRVLKGTWQSHDPNNAVSSDH